jgi:hypothetical protein
VLEFAANHKKECGRVYPFLLPRTIFWMADWLKNKRDRRLFKDSGLSWLDISGALVRTR